MLKNINVRHLLARPEVFGMVERVQVQMIFETIYRTLDYTQPLVLCVESPFELQTAIRRVYQIPNPIQPRSETFSILDRKLKEGFNTTSINSEIWDLFSNKAAGTLFKGHGQDKQVARDIKQDQSQYQMIDFAVKFKNRQIFGNLDSIHYDVARHPNFQDYRWLGLYGERLKENPLAQVLKRLLDLGLMECYCFDKLVLWCPKPSEVHIKGGKLHHEKGPALAWGDQYKMFYWKGNIVPQKLIEAPESITKDEVQNEIRSNIRKSYFEKLGLDNFTRLFDLQIFDKDLDIEGREQILYRSREKDSKTGNFIQFAKVNCPNSGEEHLVSVPLHIKNIWEAFAYSLEHKPQEFCEAVN